MVRTRALLVALMICSVDAAPAAPVHPVRLRPSFDIWVRGSGKFSAFTTLADTTFTCFESTSLVSAINPGCFVTFSPPQPGDCSTHTGHFLLQSITPTLPVSHRVRGISFRSNDSATVFPSAGVILSALDDQGHFLLPDASQLAGLQVQQITSSADTSWVHVDLDAAGIVVPAGSDMAILVALQFPDGEQLTALGEGPGIAVDAALPDSDCDFFTIDGGVTWMAPSYDPQDPLATPLDWGFVLRLEPITRAASATWSSVKALYRSP
jgi:hypothetical protein